MTVLSEGQSTEQRGYYPLVMKFNFGKKNSQELFISLQKQKRSS